MATNEVGDEAIERLLFRAASEVVERAKVIAPYKTGNLQRDIQVFDDDINQGEVSIGNTALASYAPYVHYGTGRQARGRSRSPNKRGQKAQPYLEDALDDCAGGMSDEIFNNIRDSLNNFRI